MRMGNVERTIHINHAKPAKLTAPDLAEPVPPPETPRTPLGYLPGGFAHRPTKPRSLPANSSVAPAPPAAPAENAMPPPATVQPISSQSLPLFADDLQAQSRARSRSRYKKFPCAPASPLFKTLQDGSHFSTHSQLQQVPRQ